MRALTVRQPWASLIACGAKTIETRSWSTSYRGELLIHAGVAIPRLGEAFAAWQRHPNGTYEATRSTENPTRFPPEGQIVPPLPLGAVVAVARLADCVPIVASDESWDWLHDERAVVVNEGDDLVVDYYPEPERCWRGGLDGELAWSVHREHPLGDFTPGRYAWLLTDVQPIDPVPAKGRQGLWRPDDQLVHQVGAAYDVARYTGHPKPA